MRITREIIDQVYRNTCDYANGVDLDCLFEGRPQPNTCRGSMGVHDAVYYILTSMQHYEGLGFGTILIHSDGGIRDYMITYEKGDYKILVSREEMFSATNNWPTSFGSVQHFIDWLNGHADKINSMQADILPMSKSEIKRLDDMIDSLKREYRNVSRELATASILNFDNEKISVEISYGAGSLVRNTIFKESVTIDRRTMAVLEKMESR